MPERPDRAAENWVQEHAANRGGWGNDVSCEDDCFCCCSWDCACAPDDTDEPECTDACDCGGGPENVTPPR